MRKRVSYEGALHELEHIGPRLIEAMDREIAVAVANAMEEKRMMKKEEGEEEEEEEEERVGSVKSTPPKSPPRLPLRFGRTEEGVVLSPPLPPTPPSASIVAAAARMRRDDDKYDSEDLKRLVSLLYFARLFDVKDASSVEIEHARVIQRDACIAKHQSSYTGVGSRPLTGEDLDAVVIAGRAVLCQRRDVMHHGECIAINTKAAKLFLRKKNRKGAILSGSDLVLVTQQYQQQGDSSVEKISTSSRDESGFFERMLNMGSSGGAMVATNAIVPSVGEQQHRQHQSAKLSRLEMDAIERARDVMDIIMAMAPAELSESSEMTSSEEEEDGEEEGGVRREEFGLLGVPARELQDAEQSFSRVSIHHNNNNNNHRRREYVGGGARREKRRNVARDASQKFPKRKSSETTAKTLEESGPISEDRSTSSQQPQSPSTPLQQTDDITQTTSTAKQFKRKPSGSRGGRRERERREQAQARLHAREEAHARTEIE